MSVSILIVDDETDVAALFRQHFRHEVRQGHYVPHFAYSAYGRFCSAKFLADKLRFLFNGF